MVWPAPIRAARRRHSGERHAERFAFDRAADLAQHIDHPRDAWPASRLAVERELIQPGRLYLFGQREHVYRVVAPHRLECLDHAEESSRARLCVTGQHGDVLPAVYRIGDRAG